MATDLQAAFAHNPETFLSRYAVDVQGSASNGAVGGGTVGALLTAQGLALTNPLTGVLGKTSVGLATVSVSAHFDKPVPRSNNPEEKLMFPFHRAQVRIRYGAPGAGGLNPVYVIPYEQGTARGVKLPAHGTDGHAAAYAMTATQSGCTVEVSGAAASPYVSHTNVLDKLQPVRQVAINARLQKLRNRFIAAEVMAGNVHAAIPAASRHQFGFYGPLGPGGVPAAQFLNYRQRFEDIYTDIARHGRVRRESRMFSHVNYVVSPTTPALRVARNPLNPPMALFVGKRSAAGWRFFFQVYMPVLEFHVTRVFKRRGTVLRPQAIMNAAGNQLKVFRPTVVLEYGEFWPNIVAHTVDFDA